jgi:6-phosphogluconate dehydrogenase
MEVGMVGLGRMGINMVGRLQKAGHHCVAWDRKEEKNKERRERRSVRRNVTGGIGAGAGSKCYAL